MSDPLASAGQSRLPLLDRALNPARDSAARVGAGDVAPRRDKKLEGWESALLKAVTGVGRGGSKG